MNCVEHGKTPFSVAVIHGGPGAAGEMSPVAKELSLGCGILEPLQTASSIEGQIQELQIVLAHRGALPVTLIGHSWGAWLSLLLAARFSELVRKIILVGSGPFTEEYASQIMATRLERLNESEKTQIHVLMSALSHSGTQDQAELLGQFGRLMAKTDSFDPLPLQARDAVQCQGDIYQSVWSEAQALRQRGDLLELTKQVRCPVVAIHGDYDPHPAEGVALPLSQTIRNFRFILLKNCGHSPWRERTAKDAFYQFLETEIG